MGQHCSYSWVLGDDFYGSDLRLFRNSVGTHHDLLVCFYVFITLETILKLFFIGLSHYLLEMRNKVDL